MPECAYSIFAVLRCASLCFVVLRCASLCFAVLRCASLCFAVLRCASLCFAVLRCASLCFAVLRCASLRFCTVSDELRFMFISFHFGFSIVRQLELYSEQTSLHSHRSRVLSGEVMIMPRGSFLIGFVAVGAPSSCPPGQLTTLTPVNSQL